MEHFVNRYAYSVWSQLFSLNLVPMFIYRGEKNCLLVFFSSSQNHTTNYCPCKCTIAPLWFPTVLCTQGSFSKQVFLKFERSDWKRNKNVLCKWGLSLEMKVLSTLMERRGKSLVALGWFNIIIYKPLLQYIRYCRFKAWMIFIFLNKSCLQNCVLFLQLVILSSRS